MLYTIIFYRAGRKLGSTPWGKGLDSAKGHAVDHLAIKGADRVEVRDESDQLVFQHPRTVSLAP